MTFHSLYRLAARGLLDCPIVGVAAQDWTAQELREHARACIADCGETVDDAVFERFAAQLSYVAGDFADPATYEQVFTRQDSIEETWRVVQPLLDAPPSVHPYAKGSWGPAAGDALVTGRTAWHEPWMAA